MFQGQKQKYSRLSPRNDLTFKILFSQNEEILIALLSAVLQPKEPITRAEVFETELSKTNTDDKGSFLDIHVRFENGERLDVEMQAQSVTGNSERWLYYWAGDYRTQLKRGDEYHQLKPCIGIFFLDYELSDGQIHGIYEILEKTSGRKFSSGLQFHTLELPRLTASVIQKRGTTSEAEAQLYRWCRFLKTEDPQEVLALKASDPMIQKAEERLEELSADPMMRSQIEERQRQLDGIGIMKGAARAEGRVEGRVEGRLAAIREKIDSVCNAFDIEITPARRDKLSAEETNLDTLFDFLIRERSWPE